MSLFGSVIRSGVRAISSVARVPGVSSVVKAIPVVGTVASVGNIGYDIYKGVSGSSGMPALPGNMPMIPGMPGTPATMGQRGIFSNDPNIAKALQAYAINKGNLKTYYRAGQKGFVIRYDGNGDPFAVPKDIARRFFGWKPSKKPPISVGDWHAVQRADKTVKHVRKMMTTMTRVDNAVGAGGKIKIKGKKHK